MGITKYFHIARINFINSLTYIVDALAGSLFIGVIIFIFVYLWKFVFNMGVPIEGFTVTMMLWYLVTTEAIVTSQSKVLEQIGDEVVNGDIVNYLNKPYNYILYKYFSSIGKAIMQFSLTFLVGGLIVSIFLGFIKVSLISIPLIALIILLAISLHFAMMAFLAVFALWFEDANALEFIYSKVVFILGGMLLPIEFFPKWLENLSASLPFSYVAYYPAKLVVGFNMSEFLRILLVELLWIGLFSILIYIVYKKYIKRLSLNGG